MAILVVVSVVAAILFKTFDHPTSSTDVPTNCQACVLIALLIIGSPILLIASIAKWLMHWMVDIS